MKLQTIETQLTIPLAYLGLKLLLRGSNILLRIKDQNNGRIDRESLLIPQMGNLHCSVIKWTVKNSSRLKKTQSKSKVSC